MNCKSGANEGRCSSSTNEVRCRVDFLRSFLKRAKEDPSYSATMRDLRKSHPEMVRPFMIAFKEAFDRAMQEELENPEQLALMEAKKTLDLS